MHRMKNLLVGLLIAGLPASAQQTLTLEQAIATALQNNYDIQLSRNDSMVAALDYTYRNAVFLPRINANAANQWNKNNQKQEFLDVTRNREGKVKNNNLAASVNLNWSLFERVKL